jgi:hypothetical protein
MDPTAAPRSIAKLQYAAVSLPFTVLEERVVARHRGEGAFVRLGIELFLGSLDRFAGWLLADEQISRRGQALMRQTGHPAKGAAPGTKAPARPAHDGHIRPAWPAGTRQAGEQDQEMGGIIAADHDQEDMHRLQPAGTDETRCPRDQLEPQVCSAARATVRSSTRTVDTTACRGPSFPVPGGCVNGNTAR